MAGAYYIDAVSAGGGSTTFPLAAPVGSASAPSYSYTGHTNTGWYYDTTNSALAASVGGTEEAYVNSTGFYFPVGLLTIGSATSGGGVQLKNSSTNNLYILFGDGSAYANVSALRFTSQGTSTATAVGQGIGGASYVGMYGSSSALGLSVNGSVLLFNSAGQANTLRQLTASKTSNYTVVIADAFTVFDNTGATGSITFTLPAIGSTALGTRLGFSVGAAQTIVVQANAADKIGTKSAGGNYTSTTTLNSYLEIVACNTGWALVSNSGGFT